MELGWPLDWALFYYNTIWCCCFILTEVAGEGGPDLAPQKFLLSLGTS